MEVGDRYNEIPSCDRPRKCKRRTCARNRLEPPFARGSSSCRAEIDGKASRKLFWATAVAKAARSRFLPGQQVWERRSRRQSQKLGEPGKIPDLRSTPPHPGLRGPSR